MCEKFHNLKTI